jgi:cytochrome b6-f complex iron-sulfur subunit
MALAARTRASTASRPVARRAQVSRVSRVMPVVRAAAISADKVPDMEKRNIMNLILAGGIGLPTLGLAGPFALFFVPQRCV